LEAGPERRAREVVGLTGAGALGEVALVGEAEAQVEHGHRQQQEERGRHDRDLPRAVLDEAAPLVRQGLAQRLLLARWEFGAQRCVGERGDQHDDGDRHADEQRLDPEAEPEQCQRHEAGSDDTAPAAHLDPSLREAEQRRQQRDRGDHRDEHRDGGTGGEAVDERQPHDEHAEQRDDDREPGEDDGPTGGVDGGARRLLGVEPRLQTLAVAGDDEQRVVDADADADHGAERDGEVGDRHHVRQQRDDAGADADAEQRDPDRQAHRQHRAERDDQDDDGEREADQLGLGGLELRQRLTADLDLEPVDLRCELGDLGADLRRLGLGDVVGQVDAGDRHTAGQLALGGDQTALLALRGVRTGERHPLDLGDLGEELGHHRFHLGVVDALLGAEHDRAGQTAPEPAEVLVERVEARFRLRVGNRERAVARCADRSDEGEHGDEHRDPGAEDEPAAPEAEAAETSPCRRCNGWRWRVRVGVGGVDGGIRREGHCWTVCPVR
jgi:hypothetical protein